MGEQPMREDLEEEDTEEELGEEEDSAFEEEW
jgi:hypothetical protein